MANVKETDLIGIGKKFQIETNSGDNLVVVIHDDGRRELYSMDDQNDVQCVMTLNDEESRQVAGIIGGFAYKPKALETVEVAIADLSIEWYKVTGYSIAIGKSIGEMAIRKRTGAAIIAAIGEQGTIINPGPDYVVASGTTLVVAGKRPSIKLLKDLLTAG